MVRHKLADLCLQGILLILVDKILVNSYSFIHSIHMYTDVLNLAILILGNLRNRPKLYTRLKNPAIG